MARIAHLVIALCFFAAVAWAAESSVEVGAEFEMVQLADAKRDCYEVYDRAGNIVRSGPRMERARAQFRHDHRLTQLCVDMERGITADSKARNTICSLTARSEALQISIERVRARLDSGKLTGDDLVAAQQRLAKMLRAYSRVQTKISAILSSKRALELEALHQQADAASAALSKAIRRMKKLGKGNEAVALRRKLRAIQRRIKLTRRIAVLESKLDQLRSQLEFLSGKDKIKLQKRIARLEARVKRLQVRLQPKKGKDGKSGKTGKGRKSAQVRNLKQKLQAQEAACPCSWR